MLLPLLFPSSPYVNLCCKIEEMRVKLRSPCLHITRMGGKGVLCACICVLLLLCVCVKSSIATSGAAPAAPRKPLRTASRRSP